jgi:hypothetical protein
MTPMTLTAIRFGMDERSGIDWGSGPGELDRKFWMMKVVADG